MKNNSRKDYLCNVFHDTIWKIEKDTSLSQSVKDSIHSQKFIAHGTQIDVPLGVYATTKVTISKQRSFEAAAKYKGSKTAVLNFASATTPGGGVEKGASAQEECLCRVSTLYNCLSTAYAISKFYWPHRKDRNPLHNDDIIYTKDIAVIKDDDYNMLPAPFYVDVITCAAPNLRQNPSNKYNQYDGDAVNIDDQSLYNLHKSRANQILSAAAANNAEVVILGAFGCGAFKNPPEIVAKAYADVIPNFIGKFRVIEFAIYCKDWETENYNAFKNTFDKSGICTTK